MVFRRIARLGFGLSIVLVLGACADRPGILGGIGNLGRSIFGGPAQTTELAPPENPTAGSPPPIRVLSDGGQKRGFLGLNLGGKSSEPGQQVNALLWAASLDVLSFLPIKAADPYNGVILTDFGTAPGASRAYRAEVRITSAVLDAASLDLQLFTTSGPAPAATTAKVKQAILDRARQLRSAELQR